RRSAERSRRRRRADAPRRRRGAPRADARVRAFARAARRQEARRVRASRARRDGALRDRRHRRRPGAHCAAAPVLRAARARSDAPRRAVARDAQSDLLEGRGRGDEMNDDQRSPTSESQALDALLREAKEAYVPRDRSEAAWDVLEARVMNRIAEEPAP